LKQTTKHEKKEKIEMKKMVRILFMIIFVASVTLCSGMSVAAETYPSKPLQIIVSFAPGGGVDSVARIVAHKLTESLGQPVLVDNRPGASGMIGTDLVAKAAPNGYTLLLGTQTVLVVAPILQRKTSFDPIKLFSAVTLIGSTPLILVTSPAVPAKSVKELLALAKAKPGELNFGSGGVGTTPHMAGELFASMAGIKIVHAAYKGEAPALTDIMGGHLHMMFSNMSASLSNIKAGKLRGLAVSSMERVAAAPEIPTVAESGVPGFEAQTWFGLLAPAGTPPEIVKRLNTDVLRALTKPDVKEKLASLGLTIVGSTPEKFSGYIKSEFTKWAKVIKDAGVKTE
jgi:tripartite-type tricarboxylate transporter receptor subunit TctC